MAKKKTIKEGDKVTIKGVVVKIEGKNATIEIQDDKGREIYRFTISKDHI